MTEYFKKEDFLRSCNIINFCYGNETYEIKTKKFNKLPTYTMPSEEKIVKIISSSKLGINAKYQLERDEALKEDNLGVKIYKKQVKELAKAISERINKC